MPHDPVAEYLRTLNMSDRARAAAWDAAYASDDREKVTRLQALPYLADQVKANLLDLGRGGSVENAVPFKTANPADFTPQQPQPDGSPAGRFVRNAASALNPLPLIEAGMNPISQGKLYAQLATSQVQEGVKAKDAYQQGRMSEAVGHGAAAALPVLGPAAVSAGEQIASGDVAGGLGASAALTGSMLVPGAARGAYRRLSAPALERGAASRVVDVMSPKVGANKTRFGNRAADVAPQLAQDLAQDGAPLSRGAFHGDVAAKLSEAEQGLDAASDARLSARSFQTKPLIDALLEKRRTLTAEADQGNAIGYQQITVEGKPATTWIKDKGPIGADVVPGPNAARVGVIDRAISELKQLGPTTTYEPIRRIRHAYDGPAKAVYSPSMTADYLKAQGGKLGAADVTGTLRDQLAQWDPETATANAQYSLYRTAKDVLDATAEVERTRPRVGRQIVARLIGSIIGGQAGPVGAVAGYAAGPIVDSALASGATTQLKTAAAMTRLANAIRTGNMEAVNALTRSMQAEMAVSAATTPSESRSQSRAPGSLTPSLAR